MSGGKVVTITNDRFFVLYDSDGLFSNAYSTLGSLCKDNGIDRDGLYKTIAAGLSYIPAWMSNGEALHVKVVELDVNPVIKTEVTLEELLENRSPCNEFLTHAVVGNLMYFYELAISGNDISHAVLLSSDVPFMIDSVEEVRNANVKFLSDSLLTMTLGSSSRSKRQIHSEWIIVKRDVHTGDTDVYRSIADAASANRTKSSVIESRIKSTKPTAGFFWSVKELDVEMKQRVNSLLDVQDYLKSGLREYLANKKT